MSKQKKTVATGKSPSLRVAKKSVFNLSNQLTFLILGIVLLFALVIYYKIIGYGFINMDDDLSIAKNARIRDLSLNGWIGHFTHFNMGMYAPVTETSYSAIYAIGGIKPGVFHFSSILLHLLNSVTVFFFIRKLDSENYIALVVAGLFALHPVAVESVAWAAGFSNLLYSFFYILSLYCYLNYAEDVGTKKWLWLSLFLFVLSILSKSAAITLPIVLILIDFYKQRKINLPVVFEKTPFFLLSLSSGIGTIFSRNASGDNVAIDTSQFNPFDRFLMVTETIWFYIGKLLLPIDLSFFYPFDKSNGWDWYFYLSPLALIAVFWWISKKPSPFQRPLVLGASFFLAGVSIMLPFIKTGTMEMRNDRYIYLAGIGIIFLVGWFCHGLIRQRWETLKPFHYLGFVLPIMMAGFFAFQLQERTLVWKDNISLYSNVIEQFPAHETARNNRGTEYKMAKAYQQAIEDFNITIRSNPKSSSGYMNRGNCYADLGDYTSALKDYNQALALDPKASISWYNRGVAYNKTKQPQLAVADYTKALELDPVYPEAFYNRAIAYMAMNETAKALSDYNEAIRQNPGYKEAFHNRGIIFAMQKMLDQSMQDFKKAISIDNRYFEAHSSLGNLYAELKQYDQAIAAYTTAIQIKPDYVQAYVNRASIYLELKDNQKAMGDLKTAQGMGANVGDLIRQLGG